MGSQHATWRVALLILAVLLFGLAGLGGPWAAPDWPWRGRLMAWGLFCWALSTLVIE
jgi:hypothetical protein